MAGQHEPTIVRPSDIDPHHNWDRPIQAPGQMQVDFEERVNFRRLHDYRLARVRQALARSELGALLSANPVSGLARCSVRTRPQGWVVLAVR